MKYTYYLLLLILFTNCRRDSDSSTEFPIKFYALLRNSSPKINQFSANCTVTYNDSLAKGEDDTSAYTIRVNGLLLTRHVIDGHYKYEGTSPSMMQKKLKISLDNSRDKNLYEEFDNPRIDSLWVLKKEPGKGVEIAWKGSDLNENEKITWILSQNEKTNMGSISGPTDGHTILIPSTQDSLLHTGTTTISLVRTANYKSLVENNEFNIRAEFTSEQISFEIK